MRVTILGSGTSILHKERYSAGILIETGKESFLLDCGGEVIRRLLDINFDWTKIDRIFISHPHSDHIGDLLPLIQSLYVAGLYFPELKRKKTLFLHGYKDFATDFKKLKNIMLPGVAIDFPIEIFEHRDSEVDFKTFSLKTRVVPHVPEYFNSIGFTFTIGGKKLMYSGDSSYSENLVDLAKNSDLAILEAAVPPERFRRFGPEKTHLSACEAGIIAGKAATKKLILTHIYDLDIDEVTNEARKNFKGEVVLGKDLLRAF